MRGKTMSRPSTGKWIGALVTGLILGNFAGDFLVKWIPEINVFRPVDWGMSGDVSFLKYNFQLQVKLNMAGLLGFGIALWIVKRKG
jgi:hypothetical protein